MLEVKPQFGAQGITMQVQPQLVGPGTTPQQQPGTISIGIWGYVYKFLGTVIGIFVIILALIGIFTIEWQCWVATAYQFVVGCVITLVETPYLFRLVPPNIAAVVQPFLENRPPWQKAIFYTLIAIPFVGLCRGPTEIVGFIVVLALSGFYVFLTIRRREQAQAAGSMAVQPGGPSAGGPAYGQTSEQFAPSSAGGATQWQQWPK
jgi:hypothetical protein